MAEYNYDTNEWVGKSGRSYSTQDAAKADSGGFGDGFGGGAAEALGRLSGNILMVIIQAPPYIIGFIFGFLFSGCLKLRLVGKILLTAFTCLPAYFLSFIIVGLGLKSIFVSGSNILVITIYTLSIAMTLAIMAWFWLRHYDVFRRLPGAEIIFLTIRFFQILYWGYIIVGILYMFLKNVMFFEWAFAVPMAIAIIYWFVKVYRYEGEEE